MTHTVFEWKPQLDITAFELALALEVRERLNTSTTFEQLWLDLPKMVQRHFKRTVLTNELHFFSESAVGVLSSRNRP
jgi:acetylglutamate synthase